MTRAPGDPDSDTPEWVCITGQRINPFKNREEGQVRTPEKLMEIIPSGTPGYISVREAARTYGLTQKNVRMIYKRHSIRILREGKRVILCAEDFAKVRERL